MSIDMYVSASKSQATSVATLCRQQKQGYEQLQRAINDFSMNSQLLKGAAYDSAKQFFSSVVIPLATGGILLSEAVMEACKKFPDEYMANVDSGDLKESELQDKIAQISNQMTELTGLQERLQVMLYKQAQDSALDGSIVSRMNSTHTMMASYQRAKVVLEEKLKKLQDFDNTSPDIFSEVDALKQAVKQGAIQVSASWNSNTGTFSIPKAADMTWAAVIASHNTIRTKNADESMSEFIATLNQEDILDLEQYSGDEQKFHEKLLEMYLASDLAKDGTQSLIEELFSLKGDSYAKVLLSLTQKWITMNDGIVDEVALALRGLSGVSKSIADWMPFVGTAIDVTELGMSNDPNAGTKVLGHLMGDVIATTTGVAVTAGVTTVFTTGSLVTIGATIGTAIPIPVVGTIVGAAVGVVVGVAVNWTVDKIIDTFEEHKGSIKKEVKKVGKWIGNLFSGGSLCIS